MCRENLWLYLKDLINVLNKLESLIKYIFCGYNNTLLIIENRKDLIRIF